MKRETGMDGLRLVVGIDGSPACDYALEFARRLDFRIPQHYVLVNAVESFLPDGSSPKFPEDHPLAAELREREATGIANLKAALPKIADRDAKAEELQAHGEPSHVLNRIADEEKADLVVVGHNRRSPLDDCLLGSVARRLLRESPHHVLIARALAHPVEHLDAVIATDDSPESDRCVDAFIRLAPKGIRKLYVLSVNEVDSEAEAMLVRGLPHLAKKTEGWIDDGLRRDGLALCNRLTAAGFDTELRAIRGADPASAISQVCDETGAALLVLVARPHGFWDRLLHGSVSGEVFEKDSSSLLVLRP